MAWLTLDWNAVPPALHNGSQSHDAVTNHNTRSASAELKMPATVTYYQIMFLFDKLAILQSVTNNSLRTVIT